MMLWQEWSRPFKPTPLLKIIRIPSLISKAANFAVEPIRLNRCLHPVDEVKCEVVGFVLFDESNNI